MSLDSKTRKRLQQEAERLTEASARLLIENNHMEEAKDSLARAELARNILSATKRSPHRLYFSAAIAFTCLMLAGLAWSTRISDTEVVLNIKADSLALQLTHDWSEDIQVAAHAVYLNNIDKVSVPGLGIYATPVEMEASGKDLILHSLGLSAGASLELERQGNTTVFYAHREK